MVAWPKPHDTVSFLRRLFSRLIKLFRAQLLQFRSRWLFSVGSVGEERGVDQLGQAQRKALRRALLIGINDTRARVPVENTSETIGESGHQRVASSETIDKQKLLRGPQMDAWDLRSLLIEVYGYEEGEISILIDDDNPEHLQPTKDNIIQRMKDLVQDAAEGDQFFFHFSGHCTQKESLNKWEEDGKDELIITCDGLLIQDDELSEHLVKPLPAGSALVAVFDSCHSGTLLDLPHFRCNRVYVPWKNKGKRRTGRLQNVVQRRHAKVETPAASPIPRLSSGKPLVESPMAANFSGHSQTSGPRLSRTSHTLSVVTNFLQSACFPPESPRRQCQSPQAMFCTGWCRNQPPLMRRDSEPPIEADVISLSSAKDGQRSWEDIEGSSMTQALIRILRQNSEPSLENLLTLVSHELHTYYLGLHDKSRAYKEMVRVANNDRQQKGQLPRKGVSVEMDNFQDPQISSAKPLDMKRPWKI